MRESKFAKPEIGKCNRCGHYNDPQNSVCNCANKTLTPFGQRNTKQVILINGAKRSGKDYSASILNDLFESRAKRVEILHFAEPLKQIMADTFELDRDVLDNYKNHDVRIYMSKSMGSPHISTFRRILQRFGTEAMKPHFGNSIWAELLVKKNT